MYADIASSILVVDDDQGILDSFEAMFGDEYPITLLDSGTKALQILSEQDPKLVFLDIKMPGLNGIELLKIMKDRGITAKVVIVTALPQDKYEELAHQYGVYRYLRKPFDVDDIASIAEIVMH